MTISTVLRIRRTDGKDDDFVVARVEQSTTRRLDLVLTASDGFEVFATKVKQAELDSLQNASSRATLDDWHTVLYAKLLRNEKSLADEAARDVDIVATVDGSLTITLRKTIGRITQRLGEIRLPVDDSAEVDFPQWAAEAAAEVDVLHARTLSLQAQVDEQTRSVEELRKQLDDGVRQRQGQQDELLQKFAALLNTKKLRIRDQQRQLNKAGLDPDDEESTSHQANGGKGGKNRKRKARVEPDGDDDSKEHNESATRDGNESDATQRTETPDLESEPEMQGAQGQPTDHASIPPRRELPFAKTKGRETDESKSQSSATAKQSTSLAEDDETDDEL